MRGGGQVGGPLLKRLMSRTAGLTLHWFAGVPTHDPTNNFKLYSRRFLDSVTIESDGRLRAGPRADRQGDARRPPGRRGADDLARPDRRPEQLQAPEVAAALPALVPRRVPRPASGRLAGRRRPGRLGRQLRALDETTPGFGEDVRRDRWTAHGTSGRRGVSHRLRRCARASSATARGLASAPGRSAVVSAAPGRP